MYIEQFFVEGLGCASYLIGSEAKGIAAIVDPQRDVRPYQEAAARRGMVITHIIETHLHADHVSGNTELADRTGAEIYIYEAAKAEFPHHPLHDGDGLELGEVSIAVRHTPGHTPDSVTLLVSDTQRARQPWMALTGDLLFVGDTGRPDLVGAEAARSLAGDLYESLFHNLFREEDGLLIYPAHGGGSLCGKNIASARTSTLGFERKFNPSLAVQDKDRFINLMTKELPEQPGNFRLIKAANRRGPKVLGEIRPVALTVQEAIPHFQRGAGLVDARPKEAFIALHVPGSAHLPAGPLLSSRASFVLDPRQPLLLLLEDESDYEAVVYSLARVGIDQVVGYLAGGLEAWQADGLPVTSGDIEDITARDLHTLLEGGGTGDRPVVLDVREPWEYAQGHIAGAVLIPLGQLQGRVEELDPAAPVATICASGHRSQSAADLLGQKGFAKVYNVMDGMHGWQTAGYEMERGQR